MPKSTLAGHPLHPRLIGAPTALLPFSLVMDVAYAVTGNETYAEVAYHTMLGGVVCALMGHCIESGYGLVGEEGELSLLDANATSLVGDALRTASSEQGIKLRAARESEEGVMRTVRVDPLHRSEDP